MSDLKMARRDLLKTGVVLGFLPQAILADNEKMLSRAIAGSGESLPVIGLGTWQVFDVHGSAEEIRARRDIVELLIEKGGSLIDSSPMYARSERIVGEILENGPEREKLFLATKVWTNGQAAGETQMRRSIELMNTNVMDLMQVHNLRDLDVHMRTIRQLQSEGLIRFSGVTDYRASALDELEAAMRTHKPDFIQINYSLAEREADRRVLPLARDMGIAVLINRPFVSGQLFQTIGDRELPLWAAPYAQSWGQFFLKYIVSHPAVTAVIPATSKVRHMADNLAAGFGEMPDDEMRNRMAEFIDAI